VKTTRVWRVTLLTITLFMATLSVHQHLQASRSVQELTKAESRTQSISARLETLEKEARAATTELSLIQAETVGVADHQEELMRLRDRVSRLRASDYLSKKWSTNENSVWLQSSAKTWTDKITRLRQKLAESPGYSIPEMEMVTEQDWLDVTKEDLVTEEDFKRALGGIRKIAENKAVGAISFALSNYTRAVGNTFPTDIIQLQPYLKKPLPTGVLERWVVVPTSDVPGFTFGGDFLITQKYPGTAMYDPRFYFNGKGTMSTFANTNRPPKIGR
jgi:hypothetical protein